MLKHDPYLALRTPAFRRYLLGGQAYHLGNQAMTLAVAYHIYEVTGSALSLGMIGMANYLPVLFFSLPAGAVADRFRRELVMRVTTALQGTCILIMAYLAWHGASTTAWYFLLFLSGTARAFQPPSAVAFYPTLLPKASVANAVTWNSSNFQFGAIAGPALAGFSLKLIGPAATLALASLGPYLYFIVLLGLAPLRHIDKPADAPPFWAGIGAGLRFIAIQKEMLAAITLDLFAVLFGGAEALMPLFAKDILHVGPIGLGFLKAAPFIGALGMGMSMAHRRPMERSGRAMLLAVTGFGLATLVFGLSKEFWLSLLMLILIGALDNISVVVRQTLVQLRTPERLKGRVQAVNFLFIGSSNELGEFESGMTAAAVGAVPSVLAGGAAVLIVVAVVAWKWPELRKLGRLAPETEAL